MHPNDQAYFEELKKKIVTMMQQSYPGMNPSISEWKGQEITDFQEELLRKVNAHISEKWFYTHMKTSNLRLPRIDVLNLLSKYAGYANWDDFIFKHQKFVTTESPSLAKSYNRYFFLVPAMVFAVILILYVIFKFFNTREYQFCFYDADTREPITNIKLEVRLLLEGESPVTSYTNSNGCFSLKTDKSQIRMVVSAPYYSADTIVRIVKKLDQQEIVSLHANDYALMIHYFSTMKVDDWAKRRSRLDGMIDEGAMIYQVFGDKDAIGTELYNKSEFIDKLTVPSGSLKNIEILDTKFRGEKIILLRFRVKEKGR
ncbi:MAG: hypothetical protein WCP55_22265 [Lentisphaerota bacterium]